MKNQRSLFAMCCVVATLMAGCGGSSSVKGVFADANVTGLTFACGSKTGVTGTGGTFTCSGKTVTFSVGGITVCTAPPKALMTPLSCAQAKDPTANTSTPSVIAITQFLMSVSTTPASSGGLTITSSELQAAKNLTLDFSTATQAQLLAAVVTTTGNSGATLVSPAAAQSEITGTVLGALAGNFAGTYSGGSSGSWTVTIAADGSVSGTATTNNGTVPVSGSLVSGTQYSGTAGTASWTGNLDTSKNPVTFSGTWSDGSKTGTFTGKHV
jgi:uncharacterized protein YcfJ